MVVRRFLSLSFHRNLIAFTVRCCSSSLSHCIPCYCTYFAVQPLSLYILHTDALLLYILCTAAFVCCLCVLLPTAFAPASACTAGCAVARECTPRRRHAPLEAPESFRPSDTPFSSISCPKFLRRTQFRLKPLRRWQPGRVYATSVKTAEKC